MISGSVGRWVNSRRSVGWCLVGRWSVDLTKPLMVKFLNNFADFREKQGRSIIITYSVIILFIYIDGVIKKELLRYLE